MTCRLLTIAILATCSAHAQFIAMPGTVFKGITGGRGTDMVINSKGNVVFGDDNFDVTDLNLTIALLGNGTLINTHTANTPSDVNPVKIDSLRIDATGNYDLQGTWVVKQRLTFKNGKLHVQTATTPVGRFFYTGSEQATGNDNSYVLGPMFTAGNSTDRTYPIGNTNGYFPAQLSGVTSPFTLLRMESFASSLTIPTDSLDSDIDRLDNTKYWELRVANRGSYAGAPISLSLNQESFLQGDKAVIIQVDSALSVKDLQGTLNNSFVESQSNSAAKGGKYVLGASKDVTIKIHKLITPNGDGENDALYIEGIDLYSNNGSTFPTNKVTLLDRWGGMYFSISNFRNGQAGVDYTKLNSGNYICIVEYTDNSGKSHKPKPQMITVLK